MKPRPLMGYVDLKPVTLTEEQAARLYAKFLEIVSLGEELGVRMALNVQYIQSLSAWAVIPDGDAKESERYTWRDFDMGVHSLSLSQGEKALKIEAAS